MPSISFRNVRSTYFSESTDQIIVALDDFSASFPNNKISAIIGENGSGKSTMLKCICDFQKYEGSIFLEDKDINEILTKNRNIGYVPQEFSLNPKQNVFDNIALPLFLMKKKPGEVREKVYSIAKELNISHLLNRRANEISKGQQQRVAIAKAFVKNPDIYLLDEPFSNLDKNNKEAVFSLLKNRMREGNKICLLVTHNMKDAVEQADSIFYIEKGKLVEKPNGIDLAMTSLPKFDD